MVRTGPLESQPADTSPPSPGRVRVAVDLTSLADHPEAGTLALELVRVLPQVAPQWDFLLLTSADSDTPVEDYDFTRGEL